MQSSLNLITKTYLSYVQYIVHIEKMVLLINLECNFKARDNAQMEALYFKFEKSNNWVSSLGGGWEEKKEKAKEKGKEK